MVLGPVRIRSVTLMRWWRNQAAAHGSGPCVLHGSLLSWQVRVRVSGGAPAETMARSVSGRPPGSQPDSGVRAGSTPAARTCSSAVTHGCGLAFVRQVIRVGTG